MQNGWVETMYIHLKIYEIICCFYCCFQCFIWFFVKIFLHFYNQTKHKVGNRFYTATKSNKLMETLQIKQTLSQNFRVVYAHIGNMRTNFISVVSDMALYYAQYKHTKFR